MPLIKVLTILALSVLSITSAFAENSPMYFGFSYGKTKTKTVNTFAAKTPANASMHGAVVKLGYDINNWIGFEGQLSNTTTHYQPAQTYSVKVEYIALAAARLNLRYDHFTVFALGGAGYARVRETSQGTAHTVTKIAPAFGVGIDLYGSKSTAITLSYIKYLDSTKVNLSSVQLGFTFYFDKPEISRRY